MKNKNGVPYRNGNETAHKIGALVKSGAAARTAASLKNGASVGNGASKNAAVKRAGGKNNAVILASTRKYRPLANEPFMNDLQREYFRAKLLSWRGDILKEVKNTLQHLQDENHNHPDIADRASSETNREIELRARARQGKVIAKIDAALNRLDDGTYGFCAETGEPIALNRLEARPIAMLSVEAQERYERRERVYRDA